jgi:L-aminopeptidase/D-esterase-like protein
VQRQQQYQEEAFIQQGLMPTIVLSTASDVTGIQIYDSILNVPGIAAANGQLISDYMMSGVTVILCPDQCTGTVIQQGGSPCTSQTDALKIENFSRSNPSAITLSGGSMYGLYGSSSGAFESLISAHVTKTNLHGFDVPTISSAALYDLHYQQYQTERTVVHAGQLVDHYKNTTRILVSDAINNYYTNILEKSHFLSGNVGAGTGATVGKFAFKLSTYMKGGLGSVSISIRDGIYVGAVIAVNTLGEIKLDSGKIIAGILNSTRNGIIPMDEFLASHPDIRNELTENENTAIGVVTTNLDLDKQSLRKVNEMAMQGLSDAVYPAATIYDGDTLFALSTRKVPMPDDPLIISLIGTYMRKAVAIAVRRAVCCAKDVRHFKSVLDKSLCKEVWEQFHDPDHCEAMQP